MAAARREHEMLRGSAARGEAAGLTEVSPRTLSRTSHRLEGAGRGPTQRSMRTIYLDYNTTTPVATEVQEAMLPFLGEHFGDPESPHPLGRACREAVEDARLRVARLIGCDRDEIVFTSGGTEANHLALFGTVMHYAPLGNGHLAVSVLEHASVRAPAEMFESFGYGLTHIECNASGAITPESVAAAIQPDTILVSIVHAGQDLGTVQPIRKFANVCHERGVLLHCDAAQTIGKIPVSIPQLGADLVTLSGHKMYAPKGIGALYVRRGVVIEPLFRGGGQEGGLRAGAPNVPHIIALGRAAAWADEGLEESVAHVGQLRDRLEGQLCEGVGPGLTVLGGGAERLPNTLSVAFPDVTGSELLRRTPELCAAALQPLSPGGGTSGALALGLSPIEASGAVRLSLGWYTSRSEVDRAAALLLAAWESLTGR